MPERLQHGPDSHEPTGSKITRRNLILGGLATATLATFGGRYLGESQPLESSQQETNANEIFPLDPNLAAEDIMRGDPHIVELDAAEAGPVLGGLIEQSVAEKYRQSGISQIGVDIISSQADVPEGTLGDVMDLTIKAEAEAEKTRFQGMLGHDRSAEFTLRTRIANELYSPVPMSTLTMPRVRGDNVATIGLDDEAAKNLINITPTSQDDIDTTNPAKIMQSIAGNRLDDVFKQTVPAIQEAVGTEETVAVFSEIINGKLNLIYTTLEELESKANAEASKLAQPVPAERVDELADNLSEITNRLIGQDTADKLGLGQILSAKHLDGACQSGELSRSIRRQVGGVEQTIRLNLGDASTEGYTDIQATRLVDGSTVVESSIELFVNKAGEIAPNPGISHQELTEQESIKTTEMLAGGKPLDEKNIMQRGDHLLATVRSNDRITYIEVHPSGYVRVTN